MKLSYYALALAIGFGLASCSEENTEVKNPGNEPETEEPAPEETEKPEECEVVNLSETEMANCYIVQTAGKYKFVADNKFCQGEGLPIAPEINAHSAALVWQSQKGQITDITLTTDEDGKPYISFEVTEAKGNALLAVCDEAGEIQWSWHIWMPEENISSTKTPIGYEVMNMNLGAINNNPGNAGSYGMLYQWGRKDPFPAAGTLTGDTSTIGATIYDSEGNEVKIGNSSWYDTENNTLEYSISHPTICLSNYSQYATSRDWLRAELSDDNLWGNPEGYKLDEEISEYVNKGVKTCYDPSPAGWRVPPVDVFHHFTTTGGYAWDTEDFNVDDINKDGEITLDDYNYGWHFLINRDSPVYFPAAARFDGSYAMLMGSVSGIWGSYWSNSPGVSSFMEGAGYCVLSFQVKDQNGAETLSISPAAVASKADAYSIRCIRDN